MGEKLSAATGRSHVKALASEHVSGVYRQRLSLSSGRFAMIDNGPGFQVVPWSRELGQHVAGIAWDAGGIEWKLGRKRDLSL